MSARSTKPYYSESEAARALGVTVEEFRGLLKRHVVEDEGDLSNVGRTTFHAADVLVLKLLATRAVAAPGAREPD
jgi:hypothetical protein